MGEDKKDMTKFRKRVYELLSAFTANNRWLTMIDILSTQIKTQLTVLKHSGDAMYASPVFTSDGMKVDPKWAEAYRNNALALLTEITEALEWTPWKPWKIPQAMTDDDIFNAKMEIVDALCFLLNMWTQLGGSGQELAVMHLVKSQENIARQERGY